MRLIAFCLLIILMAPVHLSAGVEEEWRYIVSLDAGPKKKPTTRDEAELVARNHLLVQRKAIEQFLRRYPRRSARLRRQTQAGSNPCRRGQDLK